MGSWKSDESVVVETNGAEGQNRTVDTSLFRAVLCQLSYLGIGQDCERESCLQDHLQKINITFAVAERAGFEPATGF